MDQTGYTAQRPGMGSPLRGGVQGMQAQGPQLRGGLLQPSFAPPPNPTTHNPLRLPGQRGQGPNAGGAPVPVQQTMPGRAGRPRINQPHNAADALATNPMHYTGSGLAQTRGYGMQRHPTLAPGTPTPGSGGNLSDYRKPPAAQGGNTVSVDPASRDYTTRFGGDPRLDPNFQAQVAPADKNVQFAPTPITPVGPADGGIGSTSSGLTAGNTPKAQPGSYGKPGDPGGPRGGQIATESGAMWDYDGDGQITQEDIDYNNWLRGQPFEGGQGILQPGTTTGDIVGPDGSPNAAGLVQQARDKAKADAAAEYGAPTADPYNNAPPGSNALSPFEQWLQNMGDVPQLDRSALEANIRADDQRQALEDSRTLQAMSEAGSRAGVDAGQATGMQGEIGHQAAVERVTRGANQRLAATVQNFQAQVQAYAQRHQAALQAAQFAQDDKSRAAAMAFAKEMLTLQTAAEKELEKYQWELSKKMSKEDWFGLALSYHQNKSQSARDAFGSFLGGGGAAAF